MRNLLLLFFLCFGTKTVLATAQIPDYLIYKGDTVAIFSNPLESYFEQTGNRELIDFYGCGSTACWRGYKAIWELANDSLFLRKITSCHDCGDETKDADLQKMFGTKNVFAYWFTGQIVVPRGKLVQYIHMGYGSVYESEEICSFENGNLKKVKLKSNQKIADEVEAIQYSRKMTKLVVDTVFYHIKTNIDWEKLDTSKYMCDDKYLLTFNEKGEIRKVSFNLWSYTKKEAKQYNFEERKCRRKIKKALKSLNLSYLEPKRGFDVEIEIFYNSKEKNLELWKPFEYEEL